MSRPLMMESWARSWCVSSQIHPLVSPDHDRMQQLTDVPLYSIFSSDTSNQPPVLKQVPEGTKEIQIGTLIAILAEEGDDISSLSASSFDASFDSSPPPATSESESSAPPSSSSSSSSSDASSTPSPTQTTPSHSHGEITHSRPLAPGVMRLLLNQSTLSPEKISELKGTGPGGRLTKGDVLLALGKIETAWGSKEAEKMNTAGKLGASQFKVSLKMCSVFSFLEQSLDLEQADTVLSSICFATSTLTIQLNSFLPPTPSLPHLLPKPLQRLRTLLLFDDPSSPVFSPLLHPSHSQPPLSHLASSPSWMTTFPNLLPSAREPRSSVLVQRLSCQVWSRWMLDDVEERRRRSMSGLESGRELNAKL